MECPGEKPETRSTLSALDDAQCRLVLVIALTYARRNGIMGEDGEDRALDFLLHLLLYLRDRPQADISLILSANWLTTLPCASNVCP